jgi:hypothetical protein
MDSDFNLLQVYEGYTLCIPQNSFRITWLGDASFSRGDATFMIFDLGGQRR